MGQVRKPSGEVVADWIEFGHHFQIELLSKPVLVGAGWRTHRLWDNGYPATGGQWHYDLDGAKSRADYLVSSSYGRRIAWLENQVNVLTRDLALAKADRAEL